MSLMFCYVKRDCRQVSSRSYQRTSNPANVRRAVSEDCLSREGSVAGPALRISEVPVAEGVPDRLTEVLWTRLGRGKLLNCGHNFSGSCRTN